ncbi:OprD family outer membrane porin [Sulfuricurvum sp.]|uniref:OprD family outer membrane porin n=1 Tax=Sulfuricurvum sp. TaxID=2025608 RepID=UPI0035624740
MKLVKMSLAAAVLLGASAFAIDNMKVDGDASVYYGTNNKQYTPVGGTAKSGLFDKTTSFADTAVRVGVTGDLMKGVSFGVTGYAVSTLGLENNLVSNTWTGAHGAAANTAASVGVQVNDASWIGEAWVAATLGKTTAKIGRMELDTPLAFSEKWSIVPNTFEAAVLINQDIPDTTLVGAWVGKGNGTNTLHPAYNGPVGIDNVVAGAANFNTFMSDGAYAAAIVNNSFKPLTAQAWYYNVTNVADAFWLQGDIACSLVKGVKIGAQYAQMDQKGHLYAATSNSSAYAFKLGYEGVENLKVSAAYSKADRDGALKIANVATANGTSQSKLYTEAYWNYGYVGAPSAESFNVTGEYAIKDVVSLGAYYTQVSGNVANSWGGANDHDLKEAALTASKDFGPLNATLAYISTDAKDQNIKVGNTTGSRYDSVLAMLKLKF